MADKKVIVYVGNPIFKDETQRAEYDNLCEIVEKRKIEEIILDKDSVTINIGTTPTNDGNRFFEWVSTKRKFKYPKGADVAWLQGKIKYLHDKHKYEVNAGNKGFHLMPIARSKGIRDAITYALEKRCEIIREEDNVKLRGETFQYALNLNVIAYDQRLEVDKLFKIRKLEDVARERKLIK